MSTETKSSNKNMKKTLFHEGQGVGGGGHGQFHRSTPSWLFRRETLMKGVVGDKSIVNRQMETCGDLVYRKNLYGHFGCVNALEFSDDGELLISGGDCKRLLLWNVHKSLYYDAAPREMPVEHLSNIFALAFNCTKTRIYSGGNDDQVIVHDIETGLPVDFITHEQPVHGVCGDPFSGNIFSTAGGDGRILIYDTRVGSSGEPFVLASALSSFYGVMFHPMESRLVLTSNQRDGVALWDVRRPKVCLTKYTLTDVGQCCMSACFNRTGDKILALRGRFPPILFNTYSKSHLFEFHHTSYYNSCTMKTCCFAGANDEFVLSGSDNFDLHVWKIPQCRDDTNRWVNKATQVLKGHRSIVNQVRYNPSFNVIASSGVEKMIKLWSPFTIADGTFWNDGKIHQGLICEPERKIYSYDEYIKLSLRSDLYDSGMAAQSISEDPRMMAFFDALVQRDITRAEPEEESDSSLASSNYTNTVYTSVESTTSSSDADDSSLDHPERDLSRISRRLADEFSEPNNHDSDTAVNTSRNSLTETRDSEVDSENEPTVEFENLPLLHDEEHQSDDADDEDNIDDDAIRNAETNETIPRGSHDPNRLTFLIEAENTSKLSREGIAKLHSRNRKRTHRKSDSDTPGDSDSEEQRYSTVATRSHRISDSENNDNPCYKKRRRIVPNTSSTPVYETSTSSSVVGPTDSYSNASSFQLISERMMRPIPDNSDEEEDKFEPPGNTESDSSSVSSSTPFPTTGHTGELKKLSSSTEDRKKQRYVSSRSVLKLHSESDSSSESDAPDAPGPTIALYKIKPDQKKRKKPTDSSTPSDSGVDMSNLSSYDHAEKPCCSKSLTDTLSTKTESIASEESEDSEAEFEDSNQKK